MQNMFIYPVKIQIEDTDFSGHVYHANYLNFMERARSEWIEQLGMDIVWQREKQIYFVVHSATIQFLKPATLHEKAEVVSAIKAIRPASIIFEQGLRSAASPDKLFCQAEIKIACVDLNFKPCLLPDMSMLKIHEDRRP